MRVLLIALFRCSFILNMSRFYMSRALAAFPYWLYGGSRCMQVMNLGVLKVVADKISALLYAVCGDGDARCGPKDETLIAANERISHMGRLILATQAPPGYVGCAASCV